MKPFAAQAATPSVPLPSGMDAVGLMLGWPSTISSRLTTLSGSTEKAPLRQAVVALVVLAVALDPVAVPLAAFAGSGPLARTSPVAAARAAAPIAASRLGLASGRLARVGGDDDGTDVDGGLNDTAASTASAGVDSPQAGCLDMIRWFGSG